MGEMSYGGKAAEEGFGGGDEKACPGTGDGDSPGAKRSLNGKGGAKRLGISRKTYYEWEEKSLRAMALALENRPAGRPPVPLDPEKESLREKVRELEKKLDLAEKTIEVKELLGAYEGFREKGSKKKR